MKIVIVGCGRVGSTLAENFDEAGHEVIIFDIKTASFDRLPETFKGSAVRGDGTDEEVLRRAGADGADIFLALTEGDNRNIMAAQVAEENLGVPRVIAKINDPVRAAAYADLGLVTLCRTNLMVASIGEYLQLPMQAGPGIEVPETGRHDHPHSAPARAASGPGDEAGEATPARSGASRPPGAVAAEVRPPGREGPDGGSEERGAAEQRPASPSPTSISRGFRRWRG